MVAGQPNFPCRSNLLILFNHDVAFTHIVSILFFLIACVLHLLSTGCNLVFLVDCCIFIVNAIPALSALWIAIIRRTKKTALAEPRRKMMPSGNLQRGQGRNCIRNLNATNNQIMQVKKNKGQMQTKRRLHSLCGWKQCHVCENRIGLASGRGWSSRHCDLVVKTLF